MIRKTIVPILIATIWISLSEFARNEFLLKHIWINHYQEMGLHFPDAPIHGAIWGVWSLCFAISLYVLLQKFTWIQASWLGWFMAFIFMWLVTGNLGVLPFGILPYAIPLSLLETFVAVFLLNSSLK